MPYKNWSGFQAFGRFLLNFCIIIFVLIASSTASNKRVLSLHVTKGSEQLRCADSVYWFKSNGYNICYRKWGHPEIGKDLKVLLLLHGIGFHSYPYMKIMNYIKNDSILVYAMDLPGHGLSGKTRGVIESNDQFLEAIDSMICIIKKDNLYSKVYLMGTSMGGIYALYYVIHNSFAANLSGLILVGPALRVHRSQVISISNLSYIYPFLFNHHKPVVNLDGKRLECSTSDQNYINTRRRDSLSIYYVSIDYLGKVYKAQRECRRKSSLNKISLPTLIIHGGEDKISSVKGSNFLNKNLPNSKTELIIYPDSRHSILWDSDSIRVIKDVVNWISNN